MLVQSQIKAGPGGDDEDEDEPSTAVVLDNGSGY